MSEGALAYSEALSGALWDSAFALPDFAWSYRGTDLRRGAVCEAYFALRDDPTLQAAFAGQGEAPRQRTPFLNAAIARLVRGRGTCAAPPAFARQRGWLRAGGAGLSHLWKRAQVRQGGRSASGGPILIQVRHPKALRTLAPLLELLKGRFRFGLSAMSPAERAPLEAALQTRDWPAEAAPLGRYALPGLAGPALWAEPRLQREFDLHLAELSACRPKILILVEGNSRLDSLAASAARSVGVPVLCLQHGWPPRLHAGFRQFELSAFLAWGEGFARLLLPMNPGLRTISVGNALLASTRTQPQSEGQLPTFFLQSVCHGITSKAFEGFLQLIEATAQRRPVAVRSHPSYLPSDAVRRRLSALPGLRWRDVPVPLSDVLAEARVTIAIHSTTIHESVAAGVLPLVLNVDGLPPLQPDVVAAGAGVEAQTLEAGVALVERACSDERWLRGFAPKLAAFRDEFFVAGGAEAAKLGADAILREAGLV